MVLLDFIWGRGQCPKTEKPYTRIPIYTHTHTAANLHTYIHVDTHACAKVYISYECLYITLKFNYEFQLLFRPEFHARTAESEAKKERGKALHLTQRGPPEGGGNGVI